MKIDKVRDLAQTVIDQGANFVSLEGPKEWKSPKGFPRGELLCENSEGNVVRRYNARKLLKWCDANWDAFQRLRGPRDE